MFIFITKKRVIRNITHSEYLASRNELFANLNVLKLRDIVKYMFYYVFAFEAFNGKLPSILNLFFIKSSP